MSRLGLTVFDDSTKGTMIADWSHVARACGFETDGNGFGSLDAFIPMSIYEAFRIYDGLALTHVVLSDGATIAYEGRIEDRRIVNGGLEVSAYGYWRALSDVRYTGWWSTTDYKDWMQTNKAEVSGRAPDLYRQRLDGGLWTAPVVGETFTQGTDGAGWFIEVPSQGERDFTYIEFDYDVTLPTDWRVRTVAWTASFAASTVEDTITSAGSQLTGSKTITLTAARPIVEILIDNNVSGGSTPTGDTGDHYVIIDAIRVKTLTQAAINAEDVVESLVAYVNGINSTQISASTARIEAQSTDLKDMKPEDRTPAEIINDLATYGDNQTPPNIFEAKVWEDQVLRFHKLGDYSQTWYTDAAEITIDSTIDDMYNRAYALYKDERGRTMRTADADDSASQSRYGVVRETVVKDTTSDTGLPATRRDAVLENSKDIQPRARLVLDGIYTAGGARANLWQVRAGDTLTIRNLPPGISSTVDRVRTMYVARTRYDAISDTLQVYPGSEIPELEFLVARGVTNQ